MSISRTHKDEQMSISRLRTSFKYVVKANSSLFESQSAFGIVELRRHFIAQQDLTRVELGPMSWRGENIAVPVSIMNTFFESVFQAKETRFFGGRLSRFSGTIVRPRRTCFRILALFFLRRALSEAICILIPACYVVQTG